MIKNDSKNKVYRLGPGWDKTDPVAYKSTASNIIPKGEIPEEVSEGHKRVKPKPTIDYYDERKTKTRKSKRRYEK